MEDKEKLNTKNVNELVDFSKRLVKVLYVIAIIAGIYAAILIFNALHIGDFLGALLKILLPLFIGLGIAWLFKPIVRKLMSKGMRKGLACSLVYVIFIGLMAWILFTLIPLLYNQTTELINQLPTIGTSIQTLISDLFSKLDGIPGVDVDSMKLSVIQKLESFGSSLTDVLPSYTVSIVSSFMSGMGTFFLGLIIGFYALIGIEHPLEAIKDFLPKKTHKTFDGIAVSINTSCRNFIEGALIDSILVFIESSLLLLLVGLKAPLLFGLFCGITNIIPYAGPYIGGIPAAIVGFSQNPLIGLLVIISIVVIQGIDGNFIQPVIMSKSTKLHPITIIMGLLIFGHFWGIIGMFISTPVIAAIKAVIVYLDDKYDILNFN